VPIRAVNTDQVVTLLTTNTVKSMGNKGAMLEIQTASSNYKVPAEQITSRMLIAGYEDGTFRPDKTVTRQEAIVMLGRAMEVVGLSGKGLDVDKTLSRFADAMDVDEWAKASFATAVKKGSVYGDERGLNPVGEMTRAKAAPKKTVGWKTNRVFRPTLYVVFRTPHRPVRQNLRIAPCPLSRPPFEHERALHEPADEKQGQFHRDLGNKRVASALHDEQIEQGGIADQDGAGQREIFAGAVEQRFLGRKHKLVIHAEIHRSADHPRQDIGGNDALRPRQQHDETVQGIIGQKAEERRGRKLDDFRSARKWEPALFRI
jgi:hypothetical protein